MLSYTFLRDCVILCGSMRDGGGRPVFGELVAAYLFLAGVGAGGIAAASLADLLFVKAPFGAAAASSVED